MGSDDYYYGERFKSEQSEVPHVRLPIYIPGFTD